MATETIQLSESKYQNYLRSFTNQNWILCLGAGICRGILPDWFELTLNLTNSTFGNKWTKDEFQKITSEVGFSLDSWIQGCFNKLQSQGKSIEEFNKELESSLYSELLNKAELVNLKKELILLFESPKQIKQKKVFELCDFFETNYSETSLLQIVKALLTEDEKSKLPSAIITFNADSLLHSLIVLFNIRKQFDKTGIYSQPKELFRKVTRTFQSWADSIPIFHLHGSISPSTGILNRDSRDSLIFLENSYNDVANSMYSWAQSTFLYSAQNSKLVFFGLSMSDPNIRRWLSWTNLAYTEELKKVAEGNGASIPHLWIKTKARSEDIQEFMDISLRHMGVKIGLIENYSMVEETFKKIM
tara:strand:+ start:4255 stop:5331 length:1077 start_codon:yes stop_codon:yes gene_type:complete